MRRRPLIIFDGKCGFCRRRVAWLRRRTGDRVDFAPFQEEADRFPHIARERFEAAVGLVEPDGELVFGAEAVFRALSRAPRMGWLLSVYRRVPGAAVVAEAVYRWVAAGRGRVAKR